MEEERAESYRLTETERELKAMAEEKEQKQEMETALRVELKQKEEFRALEEQKKVLEKLKDQEQDYLKEKQQLQDSVKKALDKVYKLQQIEDVDGCVEEYQNLFEHLEELEDVSYAKEVVDKVMRYKGEMYQKIQHRKAEIEIALNQKKMQRRELEQKIAGLERRKLSYPEAVNRLMEAIKAEFARIGRRPEPCVLCEALEISDESWRNAVEGYLNTQRFYVLVEPESFDIALGIYDRLRREEKAFGVGLINTQNLEAYENAPAGTIAYAVTSKNKFAKRFINMVLGKVQMCQRYEELKKYPTSITKECMKYQNRVASAIKPEIFKIPFIGKNAFRVQLQLAKRQKEELNTLIQSEEEKLQEIEGILKPLSTDNDVDIKYRLDTLSKLSLVRISIKKCRDNIKTLEKNATLIQKQVQLEALEKIRKDLEVQIGEVNQRIGGIRRSIQSKKEQAEALTINQSSQREAVVDLAAKAGDDFVIWKKEYEKQTAQKSYDQFRDNYDRRKKANNTSRENAEAQMIEQMLTYKTEHDFGAAPTMEGFPEYAATYDRLKTSELLEYEDRERQQRRNSGNNF